LIIYRTAHPLRHLDAVASAPTLTHHGDDIRRPYASVAPALRRRRLPPPALAIFALAAVVRIVVGLVLLTNGPDAYVLASDDGDAYVATARWAAFGEPITLTERMAAKWSPDVQPPDRWPSAYWLFLAANYQAVGFQHLTPLLLQAVLGGASAWAADRLARRLLPAPWPLVSGILVATSSTLIYLSATLNAEALYIPLLLVALDLLLRPTVRAALASGALFALSEATRPLALPVFLLALAWRARSPRHAAALVAGFTLTLAPFLATLGPTSVLTAGGEAAYHDTGVGHLARDLADIGIDPYHRGLSPSISAALTHPLPVGAAVLGAVPERLNVLFLAGGWAPIGEPLLSAAPAPITVTTRAALYALSAVGLITLVCRTRTRPVATLLALTAALIVLPPLILGLPLVRYRAPADPIFLVFVTASLRQLASGRSQSFPSSVMIAPVRRQAVPHKSLTTGGDEHL